MWQKNTRTGAVEQRGTRKPAGTHVSVRNTIEGREQGEKGALNVRNYGELQATATTARRTNSLLTGLARNPIDTNAATPVTATAAAWASALGLGGEGCCRTKAFAGNSQLFTSKVKELVLQKQLAQKGPQTESDAARMEQTLARLGNTKEANAAIIAFDMAQNNLLIAQEQFWRDYFKNRKTYEGVEEAWYTGPGARSLFDDPVMKKYSSGAGGGVISGGGRQAAGAIGAAPRAPANDGWSGREIRRGGN